jgi:hypothetical protein
MSSVTVLTLIAAALISGFLLLRYGLRGLISDYKKAKRMGERNGLHNS